MLKRLAQLCRQRPCALRHSFSVYSRGDSIYQKPKKGQSKVKEPSIFSSSFEGNYGRKPAAAQDEGQEAGSASGQEERGDIHSKRFFETLKLEQGGKSIADDLFIKEKSQIHKFIFNFPQNSVKINLDDLNIIEIENEATFNRTPQLEHNLDAILNKPGIYPVDEIIKLNPERKDFLRYLYKSEQINMDKIPQYVPPSQDAQLLKFAQESRIRYIMSTSTISSVLSQLYYLFSGFKSPLFDGISSSYDNEPKKFMISQRKPVTNILRKIDKANNIYALDSDPGLFQMRNIVLMDLGKIIERSLTMSPDVFKRTFVKNHCSKEQELKCVDDHHRFMKLNNEICLRAQIDCKYKFADRDKHTVFEIKSRSVCPIRYDLSNYQDYLDYRILSRTGLHSSFEREYYDLIRGAFLKYSFQLKIGGMDGAFIAYHNTEEIFGFEYVKRSEIERRIFGSQLFADASFLVCSKLLTTLLELVINDLSSHPYEMLKLGFYSCSHTRKMHVFAELIEQNVPWDKKQLIQQTDEIRDEYDYYTKLHKFTNTVYKYEFSIYPYINDVYMKNAQVTINHGDQIEVQYNFKRTGKASFIDYMNFLHEAYKMDSINLDLSYIGAWIKGTG